MLPSVDSYSTTTLRITLSKQTFQKMQNNPGLVFALLFYTLTNFKIPSSLIFTMQIFENYLILTQEQNDERTMLYHVQYIDLATLG